MSEACHYGVLPTDSETPRHWLRVPTNQRAMRVIWRSGSFNGAIKAMATAEYSVRDDPVFLSSNRVYD